MSAAVRFMQLIGFFDAHMWMCAFTCAWLHALAHTQTLSLSHSSKWQQMVYSIAFYHDVVKSKYACTLKWFKNTSHLWLIPSVLVIAHSFSKAHKPNHGCRWTNIFIQMLSIWYLLEGRDYVTEWSVFHSLQSVLYDMLKMFSIWMYERCSCI